MDLAEIADYVNERSRYPVRYAVEDMDCIRIIIGHNLRERTISVDRLMLDRSCQPERILDGLTDEAVLFLASK